MDAVFGVRIQLDHQIDRPHRRRASDASRVVDEVTWITEIKGDGLVVGALQPTREVGVPAAMEGYGEISAPGSPCCAPFK